MKDELSYVGIAVFSFLAGAIFMFFAKVKMIEITPDMPNAPEGN